MSRPFPLPLALSLALCLGMISAAQAQFTSVGVAGGLQFHLYDSPDGITTEARNAFAQAALSWSSVFQDVGTSIDLEIGFNDLGPNILGSTDPIYDYYDYATFYNRLTTQATSADDATAVANLQTGRGFDIMMNGTSDNPNGVGSRTPYVYQNNGNQFDNSDFAVVLMTTANVKALGLPAIYLPAFNPDSRDGFITFSTGFASEFDFDPSDGIGADKLDFVGIAAHEIGHALGFVSGVDDLDFSSTGPFSSGFVAAQSITTLDLFRYTTQSSLLGIPSFTLGTNAPDFTPNPPINPAHPAGSGTPSQVDAYFSIDGGQNFIAQFATGLKFGDGRQASHWKDDRVTGVKIGLMDPTSSDGDLDVLSNTDIRALDVIGYNRLIVTAPEPTSLGLFILAISLACSFPARRIIGRTP